MSGTIGSQIRALRTARKLTQKNLALWSGISQQHLSYLEQGRGDIELATLHKLLAALGHELAFMPRLQAATEPYGEEVPLPHAVAEGPLATRARQWERFAQWEATLQRRPPAPMSLAPAGAFADFFLSRHKTRRTQPELRARAERVRAVRELLARIRPGML